MEKFNLTCDALSNANSKIIYANLTGYGQGGPEKNAEGYDSVAFDTSLKIRIKKGLIIG